ncbi:DUF922 domain-containing protein [Pseudoalteromonas sp. SSDWG2]|uniref:DUF922 domain-containing protein n=1 Tax=Pseudoalteromonas sp. SSDWG2 TaxID=3139391 RepID=UPI003BA974F0
MRFTLLMLSLCSSHALAELSISHSTANYAVNVQSIETLQHELDSATPLRRDAEPAYSDTQYTLDWDFRFNARSRVCEVKRMTTELALTYTLPKLESDDEQVKSVWSQWYPTLAEYQRLQSDIIIAGAKQLDARLEAIAGHPNCKKLEQQAEQLGANAIDEINKELARLHRKSTFNKVSKTDLQQYL